MVVFGPHLSVVGESAVKSFLSNDMLNPIEIMCRGQATADHIISRLSISGIIFNMVHRQIAFNSPLAIAHVCINSATNSLYLEI